MIHVPTASAMGRVVKCNGSLTLPWDETEPGAAAKTGTYIHAWFASMLNLTGQLPDVEDTAGKRICSKINIQPLLDLIGTDAFLCEQAYCYDTTSDTGYEIDSRERNYPKKPGVVYGTADLVIRRQAGPTETIDFKSGKDIGVPDKNEQMRHLSLMVARAYSVNEIFPRVIYVSKKGELTIDDGKILDQMDLDCISDEARAVFGPIVFSTGDHCHWCKAKQHCKEW